MSVCCPSRKEENPKYCRSASIFSIPAPHFVVFLHYIISAPVYKGKKKQLPLRQGELSAKG